MSDKPKVWTIYKEMVAMLRKKYKFASTVMEAADAIKEEAK